MKQKKVKEKEQCGTGHERKREPGDLEREGKGPWTEQTPEWEWHGKRLTLEIDHIHGRDCTYREERLENLRFLCPSCHSQTKNYGRGGDLETEATTVSNE